VLRALNNKYCQRSNSTSKPIIVQILSFSTSHASLARTPPIAGRRRADGGDAFKALTGNVNVDGLNRYELDFFETAKWTQNLLLKMRNDIPELQCKLFLFIFCSHFHLHFLSSSSSSSSSSWKRQIVI